MLHDLLRSIRNLDDLPRLFTELGYRDGDGSWRGSARAVGCWDAFRVVACRAEDPVVTVRALAMELARAGDRALAAVLSGRTLALAAPRIGADGVTRALPIDLDRPSPLAVAQLDALRPAPGSSALRHMLHVIEVLSTEAAGQRFFVAFRSALERMSASLDTRRNVANRRLVALLALTRVLFLYFVQAKGWLDGRPDYLRSLLDQTLAARRHFHRTALLPLFFGALSRPPAHRARLPALGEVPYLNGGLFEPHPVERRLGLPCFPNTVWRSAFDDVFERFRFCVREADEVDAIAPDMLGRVFERLMDQNERERTGTFYTPETVVRAVVRVTIETALGSRGIPESQVRRLASGRGVAPQLRERLRDELWRLRVVDPAVGSGAFLLGALDVLCDLHGALGQAGDGAARVRLKREVLRRNLLGVDLNPVAVRLAELRLWLAVVSDDPTASVASVSPLPNLDGVVRQGDTLFDPFAALRAAGVMASVASRASADRVRDARRHVFTARGAARTPALQRLHVAELRLARTLTRDAIDAVESALRDLDALKDAPDLFGGKHGLNAAQRARHRRLRSDRTSLLHTARAIAHGTVPFFAFEVHAADSVVDGGFSVVVGNPPWVRAERLAPHERERLRNRFSWWRAGGERGFRHLPDLSVAFLQRAIELAGPAGAVGLLVPSKIASAGYAEEARRRLVSDTSIAYLHRVPEAEANAFGATTYPLAIIVRNSLPESDHQVRLGFDGARRVRQRTLAQSGPWVLAPDQAVHAINGFLAAGTPLRQIAPPILGVKTGADTVLIGVEVGADGECAVVRFGAETVPVERETLRPALAGRAVRAWRVTPTRIVLWAYDDLGRPWPHLPPRAAAYVSRHTEALERRTDYRTGPPWTVFRTAGATSGMRVVWADLARRPGAVLLEASEHPSAVPLNSCYVARFDDESLAFAAAAVLNSRWSESACSLLGDEARGGYRRINARVAGRLPIPADTTRIAALVDLSRRAHHGESVDRTAIDDAVAHALDLPTRTVDGLRALAARHR